MHRSHGLQGSLKRRYKHPSPTSINGYHTAKKLLSQSPAKRPTFAFADESGYTHSPLPTGSHTAAYTPKQGLFRMGALLLPSERSTRFGNPAWPGLKTANFAAFGSWSETLLKNAESLRDSDALMRVAVPRRRGPAGLRDLFRFCRNCGLYILRSGLSACARHGRYHYPWCALHVLETPDGRLSKRLICRFLRSGGRSSPHDSYFLADTQNFLLAVPVANTFALWYNKSKELEEFQNNYAVKFPFAIASSSPGPRPKQQKGSAIP